MAKTKFKSGEKIRPKLVFKNVSEKPVRFSYFTPVMWDPVIIDGKTKERKGVVGNPSSIQVRAIDVVLEPGKSLEVPPGNVLVTAKEESMKDQSIFYRQCVLQPGTYDVHYLVRVGGNGVGDFKGALISKPVKIEVTE